MQSIKKIHEKKESHNKFIWIKNYFGTTPKFFFPVGCQTELQLHPWPLVEALCFPFNVLGCVDALGLGWGGNIILIKISFNQQPNRGWSLRAEMETVELNYPITHINEWLLRWCLAGWFWKCSWSLCYAGGGGSAGEVFAREHPEEYNYFASI